MTDNKSTTQIKHPFTPMIYPDPILDIRALEALGIEKPLVYTFDFWYNYVAFTRQLGKENEVVKISIERIVPHLAEQTPPDGSLGVLEEIVVLQSKI